MRKIVFSVVSILLILQCAFSAENPKQPKISVEDGLVYFAARGVERDVLAYTAEVQVDGYNYRGLVGFQAYSEIVDFTVEGAWLPNFCTWKFNRFALRLGFDALYHFQNQVDVAYEHDLFAGGECNLVTDSGLLLRAIVVGGVKISRIEAVSDHVSWLHEKNLENTILVKKNFPCGAEAYVSASTHELYRYPLFVRPTYSVGGAFTFKNGIRPYADVSVRMCDMFVTAPYLDKLEFRLGVGVSF